MAAELLVVGVFLSEETTFKGSHDYWTLVFITKFMSLSNNEVTRYFIWLSTHQAAKKSTTASENTRTPIVNNRVESCGLFSCMTDPALYDMVFI